MIRSHDARMLADHDYDGDREPRLGLGGWLGLALVLVLPWTTLLPLYGWPAGVAAGNSPLVVLHAAALLALTAAIGRVDPWLGVFAAYMVLDAFRAPMPARAWLVADATVLGALALRWVRDVPYPYTELLRAALGVTLTAQTAVALGQRVGLDPFYGDDAPFKVAGTMTGTIGNDTWFGAFLALGGAAAPWWALPPAVVGLGLARNRLGLLALAVAVVVRLVLAETHRTRRRAVWTAIAAGAIGGTGTAAAWLVMDKTTDGVWSRLDVWAAGLAIWWEHGRVFGLGPGSWVWYLPQFKTAEHFAQAHNEYLQVLFEGGLVGLGLAVVWVWGHRVQLARTPAAWALAVLACGTFPLHVAPVAAVAIVALGLGPDRRP